MSQDPFKYRPPTEDQKRHYEPVAESLAAAYHIILENCPRSAERTLAVRALQQARMWANAAIAFDGIPIEA